MRFGDSGTVLVAKREITEALRAKAARITLAITAVAVIVTVVIAHFAAGSGPSTMHIGIVDSAHNTETTRLAALGDAVGTDIQIADYTDDPSARSAVDSGDIDVAVLADGAAILTKNPVDLDSSSEMATVINVMRADLALQAGLQDAGLTSDQITAVRSSQPPPVQSIAATADSSSGRLGAAIVMNILLFILLQTYGGWVLSGVTREKSSRVVEVLLSAVRPRQLLFGKILGIGVVALTHMLVLATCALVTAQINGLDVIDGFKVGDVVVAGVWFVLGYLLYCCAFAAAGSLCSRQEDAQGAATPIMLPLLLGYIIAFSAAGGASTLLWVLAFFPPTAVLCMPALAATGAAPVWAVLLSMAITLAAAYAIAVVASRIYRRSILRTGKRMSWRDALRDRAPATT